VSLTRIIMFKSLSMSFILPFFRTTCHWKDSLPTRQKGQLYKCHQWFIRGRFTGKYGNTFSL